MFAPGANPDLIDSTYQNMLAADHETGISALYECIKWNAHKEPSALKKYSRKLYNINGAPTGNEKPLHESVILIYGAGHFVNQIKPSQFNEALEMIIKKFSRPLESDPTRANRGISAKSLRSAPVSIQKKLSDVET
jgi:hypothetical protein